jgi:hypothetical protein
MNRATEGLSNKSRGPLELLLEVELRHGRLRRSLTEALRTAIQSGRLPASTVLPSSRRLAVDLGVSRGVVTDAYDQLVSEGYLEVKPRFPPVVAVVAAGPSPAAELSAPRWRFDFSATTPDVGLFPRRVWIRAVERALRAAPDAAFDYGDRRGRIELRIALSAYLARVRGVRVDPGRIVVTQGFSQAFDLLCRVLSGRGATTVAMETPSHPELWATVTQSGLRLVGCPVDSDGLRTDELSDLDADAAVITPAHQFPTGVVMAPARTSCRQASTSATWFVPAMNIGTVAIDSFEPSRRGFLGSSSGEPRRACNCSSSSLTGLTMLRSRMLPHPVGSAFAPSRPCTSHLDWLNPRFGECSIPAGRLERLLAKPHFTWLSGIVGAGKYAWGHGVGADARVVHGF